MAEPVVVEMMSGQALLWRCLHDGALTAETIDERNAKGNVPWAIFRGRNIALLETLTDTYGACAVVARTGDRFVGHLRFYPKAVWSMAAGGLGLCLQQEFPSGPPGDFGRRRFPPLEEIEDKTLLVHCMMLAPDGPGEESFRRRGIGTQLASTLVEWAGRNDWQGIEATAYESVPVIYESSGQAGRAFWEKLGFRLVRTEREPALAVDSEFVRRMRQEALATGLDPARLANKYVMRLALR